jgi:DNA-binding winged helix-turn-helix (wHTH) protein
MSAAVASQKLAADRLLEGEDPDTGFAQDARRWIAIYRQLIAFKIAVLARVQAQVRGLPAEERAGAVSKDVPLIEQQLARYRRRLEFWYERQWELEGLVIDEDSRTITHRERSAMLTKREYQLFITLVNRTSGHMTASELLVEAWHDAGLPEETLRTYIVRLRGKLAELGVPVRIDNRPRRGYALAFDDPLSRKFTREGRRQAGAAPATLWSAAPPEVRRRRRSTARS